MNNANNQDGYLYIVGNRGYSAYEVAVLNGFVGTEQEWLDSLKGPSGERGLPGDPGPQGPPGRTPQLRIGTVETLNPEEDAYVIIIGTADYPIFNMGIPKGEKGATGETGRGIINTTKISSEDNVDTYQINYSDGTHDQFTVTNGTTPDLTDYVKNTDYASSNKGGVIKTGNGFEVSNGVAKTSNLDYNSYLTKGNTYFIGKGTLENVITGKDLTTKSYVDGLVGDIATALDVIQGEVI